MDMADYHPYNLKIVPHAEVDPKNFFTMSAAGVTHFINGVAGMKRKKKKMKGQKNVREKKAKKKRKQSRKPSNHYAEFTALDQWVREYEIYAKVKMIPIFRKYKMWKLYPPPSFYFSPFCSFYFIFLFT